MMPASTLPVEILATTNNNGPHCLSTVSSRQVKGQRKNSELLFHT